MLETLLLDLLKTILSNALKSPEVRDSEVFQAFLGLLRELDREFDFAMFFASESEVKLSHEKLPVLPSTFDK